MSSTPRHAALLLAALLASAVTVVTAQPAPPGGGYDADYASGQGQQQQAHVSTAMVTLLAGVIAVFLFIAFSTIYLRHCSGAYAVRSDADGPRAAPLDHGFVSWSWSRWQPQRRRQRPRGLDADVVEAFPTMKYAEAKALRVGTKQPSTGALECAVCLSEFEDEDRLRLLPKCSHAFHPDCIGEWLAGHVTCPVCRCDLDPSKDGGSDDNEQPSFATALTTNSVSSAGEVVAAAARQDGGGGLPVAVVIDVVTAEEEEERRREAAELQQIGSQRRAMRRSRSARRPVATQLARSHSTGHSLAVRLDRDLERFTLRLPEHVRREMVAAAEEQTRRGRRAAGEARSAPLGRWQSLLAGTFSGKLSFFSASRTTGDSGEVSSSSSTRVRGKRVAAVDVADVPAKGGLRLDRIGGSPSGGGKAGTVPHGAAADEEKEVAQ